MLPPRQQLWRLQRFIKCQTTPWSRRFISADAVTTPSSAQIQLRPYQEESIQAVISYLNRGEKRLGLSLATGSGKTVVFTRLIERIPPRNDTATQTLILAHRQELVLQAYRHCKIAYPDKSVEIELGKEHASGAADITVASIQSINSQHRIEKFDPSRFKLILVDEAHHIVSPTYLDILKHFNLRTKEDDSPALVGVSATMSRFDGLKLGAAIDHIVYHKDYVEMINDGWLSNVIFTTVEIKADLSEVKSTPMGEFQTSSLSKAVNTSENNEATFLAWQERASSRHSTLIFCVDVKHIFDLTATFLRHGVEARFVTGETANKKRSETLDAFKRREYPVLLNCGVFTEGTDIPNIDCVLLARPTKSRNLLVQMIGRGTRLFPGKENCHIIDMVSSLKTGIVTTPTLFGLDPDELVDGASSTDLLERRDQKEAEEKAVEGLKELGPQSAQPASFQGTMTFTDYETIGDLLDDTTGDHHIRSISPFAWVQVGGDRFILSTNSGNYLSIDKENGADLYEVTYTAKLPPSQAKKSPYMRPRLIARAVTFQDAVHAADKYAHEVFQYVFISKTQAWRRTAASEKQIEMLNKSRGTDNQLQVGDVTKGQANDMITKLKFGAKGRFTKMAAIRQKGLREQETLQSKLKSLMARERVRVGPVLPPEDTPKDW